MNQNFSGAEKRLQFHNAEKGEAIYTEEMEPTHLIWQLLARSIFLHSLE